MQCQQVHLLRRLDRHEVHGWPLHGFGNRLSIAVVVLVTFEERLNVLRRDQTNIVWLFGTVPLTWRPQQHYARETCAFANEGRAK
jgi:hypothetical protein